MKQSITQLLPVRFDVDLDQVETIEFRFRQGAVRRDVVYPSNLATRREGENIIDVAWTASDTWRFSAGAAMQMDTRITLKGSQFQPETPLVTLTLEPSLFERGD
jgi:hypothetical protein